MKTIFAALAILSVLTVTLFGQDIANALRGIEVVGTAERMVVPDELTFRITLTERGAGRSKVTIEQQEARLRSELAKIGVDMEKDLSIYDLSARYVRRRRASDVQATQDYRLVIRDFTKVAALQDLADRINVSRLDLVIATNSHIEDIRRELRIEAIKAARAKAEYIMAAIGGHVGTAIYVKEVVPEVPRYFASQYAYAANAAFNSPVAQALSFAPEKETATIIARFEIK